MNLDVAESTPEGCVTHHYACSCREAQMREIWERGNKLRELVGEYHWRSPRVQRAWVRLASALDAWKRMEISLMEQQARAHAGGNAGG